MLKVAANDLFMLYKKKTYASPFCFHLVQRDVQLRNVLGVVRLESFVIVPRQAPIFKRRRTSGIAIARMVADANQGRSYVEEWREHEKKVSVT